MYCCGDQGLRVLVEEVCLPPCFRSVLSLSMNRSTSQLAVSIPASPSASQSPGLGDLRAASAKKWSRSADDLSKFSPMSPESPRSPLFLASKIDEYRGASNLLASNPTRAPASAGPGTIAFPTRPDPPDHLDVAKKHGRSLSFGRHHPSQPQPSAAPMPIPRLPTKSTASIKSNPSSKSTQQMLGSLNPPSNRPSFERTPSAQGREKDKATSSAGSINTGYTVRGFGFPFGGTHKPSSSPPQIVLSTAPDLPATSSSDARKAKRTSQMIMHQSFLMRLDHPSQSEKGKPFKAVLAGSKLQLYKPPSDKAAELREMFPDGIVPPDIEEEDEPESAVSVSPGGAPRAKRKYWGRSRHPELSLVDDQVQGSLDALIHEAVFVTTYSGDRETLARAVLLCLPSSLPQRSEFDEALMRYIGSAFRTLGQDEGEATEASKAKEKEWLEWLVGTYALLYGGLLGGAGWEDWMAGVGLELEACLTRARAEAQPVMGSPYTGVFSPRPGGSAFEALPGATPKLGSSPALPIPPGTVIPVNAITPETIAEFFARPSKLGNTLERDRLSRDVFLRVPSATIAKALRVLNQTFLVLAVHDESSLAPSRFLHLPRGTDPASLFCGSDDVPHWLTRLVLTQVLSPDMIGHELPASDTAASVSAGVGVIPEGVKVSRTHTRAAVLCKWIRLGELARVNGDECTWRAVQAAVCARAIARLERVFRRMSDEEREIVGGWARDDRLLAGESRCTPWESDVRERAGREMERARVKGGGVWRVGPFEDVWGMVKGVEGVWTQCAGGVLPLGDPDVEDVVGLMRYFRRHAEDEELVKSKQ